MCSASAHTDTRPLRGVQSLEQGGSSASATIALEADKRGSPLDCRAKGLQAKRSKNSGALSFSGLGRAGRGETPFCEKTQDSKKLESIREKETLRNLEFTESSHIDSETSTESKEILNNKQRQKPTIKESAESTMQTESKNGFRIFRFCLGLVLAHRTII